MRSNDGDEKIKPAAIDRRTLIKRAAAAGGAAWAAPAILASLPSPAAAQSAVGGCFKYMFDWRWAPLVENCNNPSWSRQNDATTCGQNTGEHQSNQDHPNPNCCEDKVPAGPGGEGNVLQWWELADISGGCIGVSSTADCATSTTNYSVTFTVLCPGCHITDGMVLTDEYEKLNGGNCGNLGPSISGFASSKLISGSVTLNFSNKVPIWFKFWVACGVDPNHPQNDGYFPDTDCQFFQTLTENIG